MQGALQVCGQKVSVTSCSPASLQKMTGRAHICETVRTSIYLLDIDLLSVGFIRSPRKRWTWDSIWFCKVIVHWQKRNISAAQSWCQSQIFLSGNHKQKKLSSTPRHEKKAYLKNALLIFIKNLKLICFATMMMPLLICINPTTSTSLDAWTLVCIQDLLVRKMVKGLPSGFWNWKQELLDFRFQNVDVSKVESKGRKFFQVEKQAWKGPAGLWKDVTAACCAPSSGVRSGQRLG